MGRSGKSSSYQLSTNKLISRVHVRAAYVPANPPNPAKVELVCVGWNGVKIHCQGKAWELGKDDTFTSESQDADIMVDVQDARVLLQWPKAAKKITTPEDTDSNHDSENSPSRAVTGVVRRGPFHSPLRQRARLQSPISPSPAVNTVDPTAGLFGLGSSTVPIVKIYEDVSSPSEEKDEAHAMTQPTQSTQRLSQPLGANLELPQSGEADGFSESDQDEENDPVVHSFGPFGDDLQSRMASINASSAQASPRGPSQAEPTASLEHSNSEFLRDETSKAIVNHAVNQLAFSRLSSTPLSVIMGHLPVDMKTSSPTFAAKQKLSLHILKRLIDRTECIGEVTREGKDAAGKKLESEYYYIPDKDFDESRRDAVVDGLKKPGLRGCRKQHKVRCSISTLPSLTHDHLQNAPLT